MGTQLNKNKPTELELANREIAAHHAFKQQYLNMVKTRCWLNDYFVTLTFRYGYRNDEAKRSVDLRRYLSMLDRAMLGKDAKRRGRKLYRYAVFELSKSGQLHIHMLLENPGSSHVRESEHAQLIVSTWLKLDCSGVEAANKVLSIDGTPEHLEAYIHKYVAVSNSSVIDPTLWHLPQDLVQCDALEKTKS